MHGREVADALLLQQLADELVEVLGNEVRERHEAATFEQSGHVGMFESVDGHEMIAVEVTDRERVAREKCAGAVVHGLADESHSDVVLVMPASGVREKQAVDGRAKLAVDL